MGVLLLGLSALAGLSQAQQEGSGYSLREWHIQDGLPMEELACSVIGHDGFLWIGSVNGVSRFDGSQFVNIPYLDEQGLPLTITRTITEAPEYGILVAPINGGLVAVRGKRLEPVRLPEHCSKSTFNQLFTAKDGALWCSSTDGVVHRIRKGRCENFKTTDNLRGSPVINFAEDGNGGLWISNATNLYHYENGELNLVNLGWERKEIRIGSSKSQGPWIATDTQLFKLEYGKPVEKCDFGPLVGAHFIYAMQEDRRGTLWIGTRSQGVYNLKEGKLRLIGTSGDVAMSLCEDREGDIWVTLFGGGLNRLSAASTRLFDKSSGLKDNFTNSVCQDAEGTMWLGNRDGGLAYIRPNMSVGIVPFPKEWNVLSVVSTTPTPDGGVVACAGPGIFRVQKEPAPAMVRMQLPPLPILRCTAYAKDGSYWFSVDSGRVGRLREGKIDFFGEKEGYTGRNVNYFAEDASSRMWCATSDGKLFVFGGSRFEQVPIVLDRPTGPIHGLIFDEEGIIWIGSAQAGVAARIGDQWHRIGSAQGLHSDRITQMLFDNRGNLWLGSPVGIFRLNRKDMLDCMRGKSETVHSVPIGKDEGLKNISCLGFYQPACWKSFDGALWFTTRRGLLRLDPDQAILNQASPPVRIEEVSCDDKTLQMAGKPRLKPDFKRIEFRYSVLCLSTPERLRVRYQLEGFDDTWQTASPEHKTTYPRLAPGHYRFRIRASMGNSGSDERSDEFAFTIEPLWWQRLWFQFSLVAMLGLCIAWGVRRWSLRRLREKVQRLERESAIERERARIAQNIHDDLGAGLTHISLLTQPADPTAAPRQLERIFTIVRDLTASMDEIVWAVNPKNDDLENLAYYLGNFSQSYLADSSIRFRLLLPDSLPRRSINSTLRHHLYLCCKETLTNIVKHARASEVSLTLSISGDLLAITLSDNGRGLEAAASDSGPRRPGAGNGLNNMRSRMEELGGHLDLNSKSGEGTRITFTIPLPPSSAQ